MFRVDRFQAIIIPPQVGILAVGLVREILAPDEQGQPVLRSVMTVTLSADHRAVSGVEATEFLDGLMEALQDSANMLV